MNAFKLKSVEPTEAQIQNAILRFLATDRRVAWAERFNTGAHVIESRGSNGRSQRRFVRYAFKGCADILGQLVDGRFLAVECKTKAGRPTKEQRAFLDRVTDNGGIGILARSVDDVVDSFDSGE